MLSRLRKILRILKKDGSAESPSTQSQESTHMNIPMDYYTAKKAMLKAERMKAKGYAMFERQKRKWL